MMSYPFTSVVICSFNGAKHVAETLEALEAQSYPRSRFEVIVVDDGSTDGTNIVASRFDVTLIRHSKNLGIGVARNTGLNAAKGSIIAYTDDDCVPHQDWLANLVEPYKDPAVMATGGKTVAVSGTFPTERYMDATGYGNPAPIRMRPGSSMPAKLYNYVVQMAKPMHYGLAKYEPLFAIYTLNASYRIEKLRAIGGFDASLRASEDSDASVRLRQAFPKEFIIFAGEAIMGHRHRNRLWPWVRQNYVRSQDAFTQARKEHRLPPLYPFPIVIVAAALLALPFSLFLSVAVLGVSPFVLYWWWQIRAPKPMDRLIFPYIQFTLEFSELLGYLTAFIRKTSALTIGRPTSA